MIYWDSNTEGVFFAVLLPEFSVCLYNVMVRREFCNEQFYLVTKRINLPKGKKKRIVPSPRSLRECLGSVSSDRKFGPA